MKPPQKSPCSKASISNAVTMPKLLEPPFRASQRSLFWVELALTIWPEASTT